MRGLVQKAVAPAEGGHRQQWAGGPQARARGLLEPSRGDRKRQRAVAAGPQAWPGEGAQSHVGPGPGGRVAHDEDATGAGELPSRAVPVAQGHVLQEAALPTQERPAG